MPTHDELRTMYDDELAKRVDQQYSMTPDARHLLLAQCFRDELIRRENERTTSTMLRYTKQVRDFTIVILVATILALAVALFHR
jgi:hypothetical protein